jgi:two-component system, chemotaxis family, chemotaxis protein CheY
MTEARAPVSSNGKRVLVVDDAPTTRAILRRILTSHGYEVIEAQSGEDAIRLYHEQRPDVVTMDLHMDKISGLGATQVILKLDPDARIIVCSSEESPRYKAESLRIGAKAYISKPFNVQDVLEALARAFA